jgi:hypothetical protein
VEVPFNYFLDVVKTRSHPSETCSGDGCFQTGLEHHVSAPYAATSDLLLLALKMKVTSNSGKLT